MGWTTPSQKRTFSGPSLCGTPSSDSAHLETHVRNYVSRNRRVGEFWLAMGLVREVYGYARVSTRPIRLSTHRWTN